MTTTQTKMTEFNVMNATNDEDEPNETPQDRRIERAITGCFHIERFDADEWLVHSDSGSRYMVEMSDTGSAECTCEDDEQYCKHVWRLILFNAPEILDSSSETVETGDRFGFEETEEIEENEELKTDGGQIETTHDARISMDTIPETGDGHACYCPHCQEGVASDYNYRTGRRDCPQCCGGVIMGDSQ